MSKLTLTREQLSTLMEIVGDGGEVVLNPTGLTVYRLEGLGAVGYEKAMVLVNTLKTQGVKASFIRKPVATDFGFGTLSLNFETKSDNSQVKAITEATQVPELDSLAALLPLAFDPSGKSMMVLPKKSRLSKQNRNTLKSAFGMTVAIEEE